MAPQRRHLREAVKRFLEQGDFPGLAALAGREPMIPEILLQYCYDPGTLITWRAMEGLGHVAAAHPGQVRRLITRLLWLLNEDSGSFGWGAAAALGEIARRQLSLVEEIIPMFVGFLDEDFSRAPMLWGIGRLAAVHPQALEEVIPYLRPGLKDPDPQVRGLTAWCLGRLRVEEARADLAALVGDDHPVRLYDAGGFVEATVGRLAGEALAAMAQAAP
jgi:hypothetical protein